MKFLSGGADFKYERVIFIAKNYRLQLKVGNFSVVISRN